jgi:hypothetical protein
MQIDEQRVHDSATFSEIGVKPIKRVVTGGDQLVAADNDAAAAAGTTARIVVRNVWIAAIIGRRSTMRFRFQSRQTISPPSDIGTRCTTVVK